MSFLVYHSIFSLRSLTKLKPSDEIIKAAEKSGSGIASSGPSRSPIPLRDPGTPSGSASRPSGGPQRSQTVPAPIVRGPPPPGTLPPNSSPYPAPPGGVPPVGYNGPSQAFTPLGGAMPRGPPLPDPVLRSPPLQSGPGQSRRF